MKRVLAVMQGRLTRPIGGRIQSFPGPLWEEELQVAKSLGLDDVEWTVDAEEFESHPLISNSAHEKINKQRVQLGFALRTVTCDFFMQLDPFSGQRGQLDRLTAPLANLIESPNLVRGSVLVIPLVDRGSPRSNTHWHELSIFLRNLTPSMKSNGVKCAFEFDLDVYQQCKFLDRLDGEHFGTNFDMGNSASQGHDLAEEILQTSGRILNVHVKDRTVNGPTVPLGTGDVDFHLVAQMLDQIQYQGPMTLQCARGREGSEAEQVKQYVQFCREHGLA